MWFRHSSITSPLKPQFRHNRRRSAQVVRRPATAAEQQRSRGLAAAGQPTVRRLLSIAELLAEGLDANGPVVGDVWEDPWQCPIRIVIARDGESRQDSELLYREAAQVNRFSL